MQTADFISEYLLLDCYLQVNRSVMQDLSYPVLTLELISWWVVNTTALSLNWSPYNFVYWNKVVYFSFAQSAGGGCKIHQLHLCGEGKHPPECPGYDTKQSNGEVPVMLELWGIRSTPSLPLLPGPLWPGVVAPDRALSMG